MRLSLAAKADRIASSRSLECSASAVKALCQRSLLKNVLYQIPSLHLQDLLHRSTIKFHCIVRGRGMERDGGGGWVGGRPDGRAGACARGARRRGGAWARDKRWDTSSFARAGDNHTQLRPRAAVRDHSNNGSSHNTTTICPTSRNLTTIPRELTKLLPTKHVCTGHKRALC